jgi:hypothetical protein
VIADDATPAASEVQGGFPQLPTPPVEEAAKEASKSPPEEPAKEGGEAVETVEPSLVIPPPPPGTVFYMWRNPHLSRNMVLL